MCDTCDTYLSELRYPFKILSRWLEWGRWNKIFVTVEEYWNRSERNVENVTRNRLSPNISSYWIVNTGVGFWVRQNSHRMLFKRGIFSFLRKAVLKGQYVTDFHQTLYLNSLWIFWKPVENIQVSVKSDKNNDTFYRAVGTFVIISHWMLLKPRNVWPKICRGNQITNFVLNNTFSENLSVHATVL
jgi:hypothetical protein